MALFAAVVGWAVLRRSERARAIALAATGTGPRNDGPGPVLGLSTHTRSSPMTALTPRRPEPGGPGEPAGSERAAVARSQGRSRPGAAVARWAPPVRSSAGWPPGPPPGPQSPGGPPGPPPGPQSPGGPPGPPPGPQSPGGPPGPPPGPQSPGGPPGPPPGPQSPGGPPAGPQSPGGPSRLVVRRLRAVRIARRSPEPRRGSAVLPGPPTAARAARRSRTLPARCPRWCSGSSDWSSAASPLRSRGGRARAPRTPSPPTRAATAGRAWPRREDPRDGRRRPAGARDHHRGDHHHRGGGQQHDVLGRQVGGGRAEELGRPCPDDLVAAGAHPDHHDRDPQVVADVLEVRARVGGQVLQ